MVSMAQATAAPSSVDLCGTEYRIRPLNEQDFAEFLIYCQDLKMAVAKRAVKDMSDNAANQLLAHAHDAASRLTMTDPFVLHQMLDLNGVARLIWISLRDFHPTLTYVRPDDESQTKLEGADAVRAMLMDPETLERATEKYEQLNAAPEIVNRPRDRRRRRRRRKRQRRSRQSNKTSV